MIYRQQERKIRVGYSAFVIPSTRGHKNCCSLRLSVFFEVKDDNSDDDNDDSGNIIFIIMDWQKKSYRFRRTVTQTHVPLIFFFSVRCTVV